MLGAIVSAVSPAVVIPKMLEMIARKEGTEKKIPQPILAGASIDDIYVIVVFTAIMRVYTTGTLNLGALLLTLPLALFLGVVGGSLVGLLFVKAMKRYHIRDSHKVLLILSSAFLLVQLETVLLTWVPFSGLIAVVSLAIMILYGYPILAERLVKKFEKLWVFAELMLFVLVGALVNITLLPLIGLNAIILLLLALAFRSLGTYLATHSKRFNAQEKRFMIASYLPKATVQASLGAVPLSLGVPGGEIILAVSMAAIVISAPLGAGLIDSLKGGLS